MLGEEKMGRRVARRDKHSQADLQIARCQIAGRSRGHVTVTSIDASHKLSIDAGRKQDLAAPSMVVDDCGSRWARNFRVMRSIEDVASMLNRFVVMNRFFVLSSCFHAEPSNFHVRQMPGFLRMLSLDCIVVQPCSAPTHRPARFPSPRTPIFSSS